MTQPAQPKPKRIRLRLTCACGDTWGNAPLPTEFQTREFADYQLANWKKQHGGHLHKVTEL